MKIKAIRTYVLNLENSRPYTIAFKTISDVSSAFVELELENGMVGIGAGNPSEYVVGESLQMCMEALSEEKTEWLVGKDIREFRALLEELFIRTPLNPSARAAIDIALHDVFTQYLGIPLHKYLGRKIDALNTSVTIGIKNPQETLEEATEYYDSGFRVLKVKLGLDVEEDIERLAKIREKYGNELIIRIDANQGYDVATTIDFFERTRKYNIELIEQPIKAAQVEDMKDLPAEIRAVIAADESIITAADAAKLIMGKNTACGIFNIKLMKCGGIYQGLRIANIAQASNIDLMWGCNDESMVSISAALNAAYSTPNTKYIDLDGSLDLVKDLADGGFTIDNGWMRPSDKPGLGLIKREE